MEETTPALDPNEQPRLVGLATKLLYASLAISVLPGISNLIRVFDKLEAVPTTILVAAAIVGTLLVLGLSALVIYKIGAGRNWARILLLIYSVMGVIRFLPILMADQPHPVVSELMHGSLFYDVLLRAVVLILQIVAAVMVFHRSSSHWFRRSKVARPEEAGTE